MPKKVVILHIDAASANRREVPVRRLRSPPPSPEPVEFTAHPPEMQVLWRPTPLRCTGQTVWVF